MIRWRKMFYSAQRPLGNGLISRNVGRFFPFAAGGCAMKRDFFLQSKLPEVFGLTSRLSVQALILQSLSAETQQFFSFLVRQWIDQQVGTSATICVACHFSRKNRNPLDLN